MEIKLGLRPWCSHICYGGTLMQHVMNHSSLAPRSSSRLARACSLQLVVSFTKHLPSSSPKSHELTRPDMYLTWLYPMWVTSVSLASSSRPVVWWPSRPW